MTTRKWVNTCAVRMSFILNSANVIIPGIPGKTVAGKDKKQYFFRVTDVIVFLKQRWGRPDVISQYPPLDGGPLAGKRGLIMFEVSGWNDATGHATLWDGLKCHDYCYFNPNPNPMVKTLRANFLALQ